MNNEKNFMDLFEEIFGHPFDLSESIEENKEKEKTNESHEGQGNLFDAIDASSFSSSCSSKEDTEEKNNFDVVKYASRLEYLYNRILKDIMSGNYTEDKRNEDAKNIQALCEKASKSIYDDIESHKTVDDTEEDFDWRAAVKKNVEARIDTILGDKTADTKDFAWKEAIRKKNLETTLTDSCSCPKIIICCPDSVDKILDSLEDIKNKNLKDFHETVSTIKATNVTDLDKKVYGSLVENSDSRCEIHYHDLEQELYIACNDLEELQRAVPEDLLHDCHGYTFNYSQGIFFYTFPYDTLVKFNATTIYHI